MLKKFKLGGIHPADNKITKAVSIETMPIPKRVIISLAQHIGAPAEAVVKKGDEVKVGQLIGKSTGFISANIHSSVSGVVKSVDSVVGGMGQLVPAVTIDVEGDVWLEEIDRTDTVNVASNLSSSEIVKIVTDAGLVGMGGATFPTNVKLSIPQGKKATVLIINGVECEPYLTSDHRLMLERSSEIIVGIKLICKAIGVDKAYIGIENNKPDAIDIMQQAASKFLNIEIVPLRVQYPQGGEKQLIDAVTSRQVPSGSLPIEVGAVVLNIGTVYATYQAVQKNKPLFERVVTVTGKNLTAPKNLLVRIGTPISELIDYCGGLPEDTMKVIDGGPMMGRSMSNLNSFISKGSSGVLLMGEKDVNTRPETDCIRCGKCIQVCPMGIQPYMLNLLSSRRRFEDVIGGRVMDCIECGSCSYVCPANIRLLDNIRMAKREASQILRNRK